MGNKLKKNIFFTVVFTIIIFAGLSFYSDFNSIISSFQNFSLSLIPLLLLIMLLNFFARFAKWHYYIRLLKINISLKDSCYIFFSGLAMGVTPGKWGELLKSYMVKEITAEPISKTAPIVFAERMTDIISLIILALIGTVIYEYNSIGLIFLSIGFLVLLYFIGNHSFGNMLIKYLNSFNFIRKYITTIENLYRGSFELLKIVPLTKMILLSFVMWFIEFFGFYIILRNFIPNISFVWASFVYALAIIVGSFSMLPGGLGFTEGTLTFFLVNHGLEKGNAVAATVIVRVITLWFSVLLGFLVLSIYKKKRKDHLFNFENIDISNNKVN